MKLFKERRTRTQDRLICLTKGDNLMALVFIVVRGLGLSEGSCGNGVWVVQTFQPANMGGTLRLS